MASIDRAHLVVGKIGSPYGVKGWVKIQSYTEYGPDLIEYQPWHILNAAGGWETITVEDYRIQHDNILVKLVGIDSPEKAKIFAGKTIAISRTQLPKLPSNEYYWSDLEGLTVINTKGQNLGTVSYVMATGSNDVLVVKHDREHAIPYLPGPIIKEIDLSKRQILVDWEEI